MNNTIEQKFKDFLEQYRPNSKNKIIPDITKPVLSEDKYIESTYKSLKYFENYKKNKSARLIKRKKELYYQYLQDYAFLHQRVTEIRNKVEEEKRLSEERKQKAELIPKINEKIRELLKEKVEIASKEYDKKEYDNQLKYTDIIRKKDRSKNISEKITSLPENDDNLALEFDPSIYFKQIDINTGFSLYLKDHKKDEFVYTITYPKLSDVYKHLKISERLKNIKSLNINKNVVIDEKSIGSKLVEKNENMKNLSDYLTDVKQSFTAEPYLRYSRVTKKSKSGRGGNIIFTKIREGVTSKVTFKEKLLRDLKSIYDKSQKSNYVLYAKSYVIKTKDLFKLFHQRYIELEDLEYMDLKEFKLRGDNSKSLPLMSVFYTIFDSWNLLLIDEDTFHLHDTLHKGLTISNDTQISQETLDTYNEYNKKINGYIVYHDFTGMDFNIFKEGQSIESDDEEEKELNESINFEDLINDKSNSSRKTKKKKYDKRRILLKPNESEVKYSYAKRISINESMEERYMIIIKRIIMNIKGNDLDEKFLLKTGEFFSRKLIKITFNLTIRDGRLEEKSIITDTPYVSLNLIVEECRKAITHIVTKYSGDTLLINSFSIRYQHLPYYIEESIIMGKRSEMSDDIRTFIKNYQNNHSCNLCSNHGVGPDGEIITSILDIDDVRCSDGNKAIICPNIEYIINLCKTSQILVIDTRNRCLSKTMIMQQVINTGGCMLIAMNLIYCMQKQKDFIDFGETFISLMKKIALKLNKESDKIGCKKIKNIYIYNISTNQYTEAYEICEEGIDLVLNIFCHHSLLVLTEECYKNRLKVISNIINELASYEESSIISYGKKYPYPYTNLETNVKEYLLYIKPKFSNGLLHVYKVNDANYDLEKKGLHKTPDVIVSYTKKFDKKTLRYEYNLWFTDSNSKKFVDISSIMSGEKKNFYEKVLEGFKSIVKKAKKTKVISEKLSYSVLNINISKLYEYLLVISRFFYDRIGMDNINYSSTFIPREYESKKINSFGKSDFIGCFDLETLMIEGKSMPYAAGYCLNESKITEKEMENKKTFVPKFCSTYGRNCVKLMLQKIKKDCAYCFENIDDLGINRDGNFKKNGSIFTLNLSLFAHNGGRFDTFLVLNEILRNDDGEFKYENMLYNGGKILSLNVSTMLNVKYLKKPEESDYISDEEKEAAKEGYLAEEYLSIIEDEEWEDLSEEDKEKYAQFEDEDLEDLKERSGKIISSYEEKIKKEYDHSLKLYEECKSIEEGKKFITYKQVRLNITFKDSCCLIPDSLDNIAKSFKTKTQKLVASIDHAKVTLKDIESSDFRDRILVYLKNDVMSLHEILVIFTKTLKENYDVNLIECLTSASVARKVWLKEYSKKCTKYTQIKNKSGKLVPKLVEDYKMPNIYTLSEIAHKIIKPGYFGGRCEVFHQIGSLPKIKDGGYGYYDFTSLYPFIMNKHNFFSGKERIKTDYSDEQKNVWDKIKYFVLKEDEDFIGHLSVYVKNDDKSLSDENYTPLLCVSNPNSGKLCFPKIKNEQKMCLDSRIIKICYERNYGYKFRIIEAVLYEKPSEDKSKFLFRSKIRDMYDIKASAEKANNSVLRQTAKIILNSSYGFWGMNLENKDTYELMKYYDMEKDHKFTVAPEAVSNLSRHLDDPDILDNFELKEDISRQVKHKVFTDNKIKYYLAVNRLKSNPLDIKGPNGMTNYKLVNVMKKIIGDESMVNVGIASSICQFARLELYELISAIKSEGKYKVFYCDTDSIITDHNFAKGSDLYKKYLDKENIDKKDTDNYGGLGLLVNEGDKNNVWYTFDDVCIIAPKCYALRKDDKSIIKFKGTNANKRYYKSKKYDEKEKNIVLKDLISTLDMIKFELLEKDVKSIENGPKRLNYDDMCRIGDENYKLESDNLQFEVSFKKTISQDKGIVVHQNFAKSFKRYSDKDKIFNEKEIKTIIV